MPRWQYLRHAILSTQHAILVITLLLAGAFGWDACGGERWTLAATTAAALALAGVEAAYLWAASCLPMARRRFERVLDERRREAAVWKREALLSRLGGRHRLELLRLERLLDVLDRTALLSRKPLHLVTDACRALLATYVRLAVAHHESERALEEVDVRALRAQVDALEAQYAAARMPSRALLETRLEVARSRLLRFERSTERVDAMAVQLALVGERIRLAYEDLVAPPPASTETRAKVERRATPAT